MEPTETTAEQPVESNNYLLPPGGHAKIGDKVLGITEKCLKHKEAMGIPKKLNRNYELRANQHWENESDEVTLLTANFLGVHHTKSVNAITNNNPTFNVSQNGEIEGKADELLDQLRRVCDNWWVTTDQQQTYEESVSTGGRDGTVAEKLWFDVEDNFPYGEVVTETLDMLSFSMYPCSARKVKDAEAILMFRRESVAALKRKYPQFAEEIIADKEVLQKINDTRQDSASGSGKNQSYSTTYNSVSVSLQEMWGTNFDDDDETLLVEMWVRDDPSIYSGGIRMVQICSGGMVVLRDVSNPSISPQLPEKIASKCYLYSRFPFSLTQDVTDPTSMYGIDDFSQLEAIQMEIDKTLSQLALVKNKAAGLKLMNAQTSGVTNEELDNMPGIINPTTAMEAAAIRYMEVPTIDPHLPALVDIYKDMFFTVAQTFDMEAGNNPSSQAIATGAIAQILENNNRSQRNKIRNYGRLITSRGRMFISLAQNFYTEERWITYKLNGRNQTARVTGEELRIPADIQVVPGSTMPKSDIQKAAQAEVLRRIGDIDQRAHLEILGISNSEDIINRMQEGQYGEFFQKLVKLGYPEDIIEKQLKPVSQLDDKDLAAAVESQEILTFGQVIEMAQQQGPSPEQLLQQEELKKAQGENAKLVADTQRIGADAAEKQAQAMKVQAEAQSAGQIAEVEIAKVQAEIKLIEEKARTESKRVEVMDYGMFLDGEMLKINKASTGKSITTAGKINSAQSPNGGPYTESGFGSNNRSI